MLERCSATNKAGERCGSKALPGSAYCFVHDPKRIVDITEARRAGGRAKSNKSRARKAMVDGALSPAELQGVIGATIRAVLSGAKPPGIGQAVASLARAALEVGKAADLEERITAMEAAVAAQQEGGRWGA